MKQMRNILYLAAIIIITTFTARASNNMISTTVPLLAKYVLFLPQYVIGILAAISSASSFITTIFINARLNSKQRRDLFIISSLIYTITIPLYAFSNTLFLWVLSILTGACLGLIMPNIITAASLLEDRKLRERIIALYTLTLSLSLIVGPAIESYLLKFLNLREVFIYFSIFGFILFIASFYLEFPEEKHYKGKAKVWNNQGFRAAIFNILIYNIPFAIITTFIGIYEKETFNISLSEITLVYSFFFSVSFSTRLFLFLKPPERIVLQMFISAILTGLGLILIYIAKDFSLFLVGLALLGIPHGSAYPLSVMTIGRSFKIEERNVANSNYFSVMMIIGILVPIISGYIISDLGFGFIFLLLIIFVFIFLILLLGAVRSQEFKNIMENNLS